MDKQNLLRVTLHENQFMVPSYQQYGGMSGLCDYGVLGTKVKNNFLAHWREFFFKQDDIEEIETPTIMPYDLLKASGHVDRFTDFVIYDDQNICHRADHLLKNYLRDNQLHDLVDKVDTFTEKELEDNINKYKIVKDDKGKPLEVKVSRKNLMFEAGDSSQPAFLRPELAQGIFCNFKQIHQFLKRPLPFGISQVGSSYRKEISPQPFIRLRSFTQAEIEFFVDPTDKSRHPKFDSVRAIKIPLMTSDMQLKDVKQINYITVEDAITSKLISHQTMAYFLARIYRFALSVGLREDKIRFRQHLPHEMAHYASECWDLEALVNESWLECVGVADRGSYDLKAHSKPNSQLTVKEELDAHIYEKHFVAVINKKSISQTYSKKTNSIVSCLEKLTEAQLKTLYNLETICVIIVDANTKEQEVCILTKDMVNIVEEDIKITTREFHPHVIEPSFGVDRLIYAIIEQNFWARPEDQKRWVMSLPHKLAPYHVAVYQLFNRPELLACVDNIKSILKSADYSVHTDKSSTSIGKRYVRADEIGIKYVITVDPGTLEDRAVTIRDRDSTNQIRVPFENLVSELSKLQ